MTTEETMRYCECPIGLCQYMVSPGETCRQKVGTFIQEANRVVVETGAPTQYDLGFAEAAVRYETRFDAMAQELANLRHWFAEAQEIAAQAGDLRDQIASLTAERDEALRQQEWWMSTCGFWHEQEQVWREKFYIKSDFADAIEALYNTSEADRDRLRAAAEQAALLIRVMNSDMWGVGSGELELGEMGLWSETCTELKLEQPWIVDDAPRAALNPTEAKETE